ncbi:serine protease, S1-C subfamily, contains C-terminal PDZ domain [Arthrobacter subterraneus]|uniref:Serine protease, S1-C subfamily, contains C-terminal PDZ domain n=1 Tax=Arthrobacter subterraneus TaxID=335973 RepID=A0A1G8KZ97_9MICC|nr:trypsin-like peptidase domain-containing protein [Arthrobacter subterraneus]SDI48845.1 serine protease, S1-C subfamily, contains C-terminal PDZ domain [Arthrobacter subterraneus]
MSCATRPMRARGLAAVVVAVVLALTGCTAPEEPEQENGTAVSSATAAPGGNDGNAGGPPDAVDIPQIIDDVQPSVVTIFLERGGLGSGVIYSEDGLIITNEHVVRGAEEVQVAFADGQRVAGTVVASDVVTDLALVQADRTGLPPAEFQTELPEVGELAVVIGSPLGFENTATAGIISGLHREIPGSATNSASLVDLVQTDAAISPGNSGGALVNSRGQVVGISEAYIPPQAGAVSLGFAIPAGTAVEVVEELLEDGSAEHAFLGLAPRTVTPQIAQQLGVSAEQGVVVLAVENGGPADEAGIRAGDILVSLDGEPLASAEQLLAALRAFNPGETVTAELIREGENSEVDIVLGERPVRNG